MQFAGKPDTPTINPRCPPSENWYSTKCLQLIQVDIETRTVLRFGRETLSRYAKTARLQARCAVHYVQLLNLDDRSTLLNHYIGRKSMFGRLLFVSDCRSGRLSRFGHTMLLVVQHYMYRPSLAAKTSANSTAAPFVAPLVACFPAAPVSTTQTTAKPYVQCCTFKPQPC